MSDQDPFGLNVQAPLSIHLVQPDRRRMICLEAIDDAPEPAYCIHGRTKCMDCGRWCWLGAESLKVVEGGAMPFCLTCAEPVVNQDGVILGGHTVDPMGHG